MSCTRIASAVFLTVVTVSPATAGLHRGSAEAQAATRRECCTRAVWLAQEDGIRLCDGDGARAKLRPGTMRGTCTSTRPDGAAWHCKATSSVTCR